MPEGQTVSLEAGNDYTCALLGSGRSYCWGSGIHGQLGNGLWFDRWHAVPVAGLFDGSSISAGAAHTCVAKADGTVACWGSNLHGQLGFHVLLGTPTATNLCGE